jgi:hypothetical protein
MSGQVWPLGASLAGKPCRERGKETPKAAPQRHRPASADIHRGACCTVTSLPAHALRFIAANLFSCGLFRKESANVNVSITLDSSSSNHAKIMQVKAKALLVSFTKFDKTFFCART